MSSYCMDSESSSLLPLSATCSTSAVQNVIGGVPATSTTTFQQPQQQQQQHVDPARITNFSPSSASPYLSHSFSESREAYRSGAVFADGAVRRKENPHWSSRPAHLSALPSSAPWPEKFVTVMAASEDEDDRARLSRGSGLSQPNREVFANAELQPVEVGPATTTAATTAAATTLPSTGFCESEVNGKENYEGAKQGQHTRRASSDATTSVMPTDISLTHRLLLPRSTKPTEALSSHPLLPSSKSLSSNSNELPKNTSSSANVFSQRSTGGTPAPGTRATTVAIGEWVPYTPPAADYETVKHREDSSGAGFTGSAHTTSSNTLDGSPSMLFAVPPARSSLATATTITTIEATGSTAATLQSTPPNLSFSPSVVTVCKEAGEELAREGSAENVTRNTTTTPEAVFLNDTAKDAAATTKVAAVPARRVKQRPPPLFVSLLNNQHMSPTLATDSPAEAASAASGSPLCRPPTIVPSRRGQQETTAVMAMRRPMESGRAFADAAHGTSRILVHSSSFPFASQLDSSKLRRQKQRPSIAANIATGFSGSSFRIRSAPTSTADYPEEAQRHQQASSPTQYPADPPSESPSPTSTGPFTIISTTHGDDEEEDDSGDGGHGDVGNVHCMEENYVERQPPRHFSQVQLPHRLQQQHQPSPIRGLQGPVVFASSPPRPIPVGPLMTPLSAGLSSRKENSSAPTMCDQSSSPPNHNIILGRLRALTSGPAMASSAPTSLLHYCDSRTGSATAGRGRSFSMTTVLSPSSSLSSNASHYVAGNSITEPGGRAASGGTPSHHSFASPTLPGGKARNTRPPPLALTPTLTTAAATTAASAPPVNTNPNINTAVVPAPNSSTCSAATVGSSAALPTLVKKMAARCRAPPPSLFKARSPVTEGVGTNSGATASPKTAFPGFILNRAPVTSPSGLLSTPPLSGRMLASLMGACRTVSESGGGTHSPDVLRNVGNNTTTTVTTPNFNTSIGSSNNNAVNMNSNAVWRGPLPNRPHSGAGAGSAIVRLSHDRRTLIAGIFRVSRDGCLTVRNMLLLNPTRIDAAAATNTGGNGLHSSLLNADMSCRAQLLHPQRRGVMNYSPVSSNGGGGGGMAGRMLTPHAGQGPATPDIANSYWFSPQVDGPAGALGSAGPNRVSVGGGGHRNPGTTYDMGAVNPNASFMLFSTSMDTPYSPITYSLDSQRLAFPNLSGYHPERVGGLIPPQLPGMQLLRAAREDATNDNNNNANNSINESTPTTTATANFLTAGNTGGGVSGVVGSGVQEMPPSSTTFSRTGGCGGANNSLYRAQLRRQTSVNWVSGMQNPTNAASPTTTLHTAGSVNSVLSPGGFNVPDTANSLLMPYADIPAWRNGSAAVATQTSSNFVGSPATNTNPNIGGGFTAISTAGLNMSGSANPHAASATSQLPPNVVRLRDVDVLSTSVGEGASATVFVAIHKPTGRRLAVKRVDLSPLCLGCASPYLRSGGGDGRIRQLQQIVIRELQVLHLTYRSPFMVKVYNAFFLPECAALDIVMEFMHYGSLDHLANALQKHARLLRESQQQLNRLLFPEDDGETLGTPPVRDREGAPTSPCRHSDVVASQPHTTQDQESSPSRAGSGMGGGGDEGDGGKIDTDHAHGSGSVLRVTHLSPKLLDFGRKMDQQQAQLRGRRLSLDRTHELTLSPSPGSGLVGAAAVGSRTAMSNTINNTTSTSNDGGDEESVQLDTFSIRSNCGTDDTEPDDGSGHMEEPYGVTERLVAVVGEQLLRGVRDMHSRGYIHRDIKPGNVLVNEHGVVKLSDFGLSQRCDDTGTGIKNIAMTYIPPPSAVQTMQNTPMHSPSMSALQLSGGKLAQRQRSANFSPFAQGPLGLGDICHRQRVCIGVTSPDTESSLDKLMLSTTRANSMTVQQDGMDVLDAASTSSSSSSDGNGGATRQRTGVPCLSSSSSDAGGNCSGTNKYMSPERQRGEPHGKPADIWAVGVTLAEFAVGEYPYNVEDVIDEFDRVSRLEKPVDVLQFNEHRAAPLSTVFADFIHLATLPVASQRPTAQELLEHPFFKQWHKPFNLKDYLAARVLVPSNQLKNEYLAKHRLDGAP